MWLGLKSKTENNLTVSSSVYAYQKKRGEKQATRVPRQRGECTIMFQALYLYLSISSPQNPLKSALLSLLLQLKNECSEKLGHLSKIRQLIIGFGIWVIVCP